MEKSALIFQLNMVHSTYKNKALIFYVHIVITGLILERLGKCIPFELERVYLVNLRLSEDETTCSVKMSNKIAVYTKKVYNKP